MTKPIPRTAASRSSTRTGTGAGTGARLGRRAVLAFALVLPGALPGQDDAYGLEGRMARVERLLDNRGLLDLLGEVEKLNREIRLLRGEMEVQRHAVERLSAHQDRLYGDLEARLLAVERGAGPAPERADAVAPEAAPEPVVEAPAAGQATPPIADPEAGDPGPPAPPIAAIEPASEEGGYQSAFNLLKLGQYDQSITAFGDFMKRFPRSPHADNAQYWLAEAYYVTHRYEPAIAEYNRLVTSYPESQKLTHALLKIGYSYHELGKVADAKQSLEDLKLRYPGTTAARLADERLQRIRLEHQ